MDPQALLSPFLEGGGRRPSPPSVLYPFSRADLIKFKESTRKSRPDASLYNLYILLTKDYLLILRIFYQLWVHGHLEAHF